MCYSKHVYHSALIGAFPDVQAIHNIKLISHMVLLFNLEDTVSMISKKNVKFLFTRPQDSLKLHDFHYIIISVFNAVPPEGLKIMIKKLSASWLVNNCLSVWNLKSHRIWCLQAGIGSY